MNKLVVEYLDAIETSKEEGVVHNSPLKPEQGFSGEAMLGALQRLTSLACADQGLCYLEVGVFQGLSLVSVSAANADVSCFGIDNFSQFDEGSQNKLIAESRIKKAGCANANLIEADYEEALERLSDHVLNLKVGLYFIDGPHDYRSQLMCLALIKPFLTQNSLIVIDDANYAHVRQANRDFLISHPEFGLLYESYTGKHPTEMSAGELKDCKKGWWDGVNIIMYDPAHSLNRIFPQTRQAKHLYFQDHNIHFHPYSEFALQLLDLLAAFARKPWRVPQRVFSITKDLLANWKTSSERGYINTYCDGIEKERKAKLK